jgi:ribosomal-protein-alanine N-acetyltransferase
VDVFSLPRLETSRLIIRMPKTEDAKAIAHYFFTNEKYFRPTDPVRNEKTLTEEYWIKRISEIHSSYFSDQSLNLFLFPKEKSEQVIGSIGYTHFMRGPFQACYLGYSMNFSHQGLGFMTEALRASNSFVFEKLKLHRIMANHMPRNERSAAVLKKLGFTIEGLAKDYVQIQGKWEDHVLTSLVSGT